MKKLKDYIALYTGQILFLGVFIWCIINNDQYLGLLVVYIAGICDGLMDASASYTRYRNTILSLYNPLIFSKTGASPWKYKKGISKYGEAFYGSVFLFTALTGFWWFIKTVMLVLISLGFIWLNSPLYFLLAFVTGKHLSWDIVLPYNGKLTILQRIFLIVLKPYYYVWNWVTDKSNKEYKAQFYTGLKNLDL